MVGAFTGALRSRPTRRQLVEHISDVAVELISEQVHIVCRHCAYAHSIQFRSESGRINDFNIAVCETTGASAWTADMKFSSDKFVVRAAWIVHVYVAADLRVF